MRTSLFSCKALFFFCLMMATMLSYAQGPVAGRVISGEDQKPVVGATIKVKGTTKQTISDANGNFSIAAKDNDLLVITSIGFSPVEVKASENLSAITLSIESKNLNEVVVTALGIRKETKRIGYSVQEVKGADLLKARESNPVNSLVGKVAGLNVGMITSRSRREARPHSLSRLGRLYPVHGESLGTFDYRQ